MAAKIVKTWLKKFEHKIPAWVKARIDKPVIFAVNRRQVPRGIALGFFCGFVAPVAQIPLAVLLSPFVRANVLVATISTFITNPLTLPLIYAWAYGIGSIMLSNPLSPLPQVQHPAAAVVLGVAVLALLFPVIGYYGSVYLWERGVRLRWKERRLRRQSALKKQIDLKRPEH